MQKQVSPKIVALTFGILVISFLVAFYVVAWQEPTQAPPGGNVAAPLNVSNVGQSKAGGLILNTGGAVNGLIIDKGNLCLGADCRSSWPAAIPSGMIAMFDTSCPAGWTRFADLDDRFARGASAYGGTGGSSSHSHSVSGSTGTAVGDPANYCRYSGGCGPASYPSHSHAFSETTSDTNHLPPYLNVVWCKKN